MGRRPVIGISACMFHPDPERPIFKGKRLLYMEESMFHYVAQNGGIPVLLTTTEQTVLSPRDALAAVDGLLLSGGVDVAPQNYGETALEEAWQGDAHRDAYEIALYNAAKELHMPVLGICRGMQLINVAEGGSLFQDIQTANPQALVHRDWDIYEHNFHDLSIKEGSYLSQLYGGATVARINSIHHQAVKSIGEELEIMAHCPNDQTIEAFKHATAEFVLGVQWHPEFQTKEMQDLLDPDPIIAAFVKAAKEYSA